MSFDTEPKVRTSEYRVHYLVRRARSGAGLLPHFDRSDTGQKDMNGWIRPTVEDMFAVAQRVRFSPNVQKVAELSWALQQAGRGEPGRQGGGTPTG
jgi:hypothetical protein